MFLPFSTSTFIATPSPEKNIAYQTFLALKDCLTIIGRLLCLVAEILLLTFLTAQINRPDFHHLGLFFFISLNILNSFLATKTRCLFCSSVNRCGTYLAKIFWTFKCFFKIKRTVDSDMPTFHAISQTVNLASPSMISFHF